MTKLETLTEQYIFEAMAAGIVRDMDGENLPPEYFPDIIVMMMNEEMGAGRLTSGLTGYCLAKGEDVIELGVLIPRDVSVACLELIRPYANGDRPDLLEIITRCDRANNNYLTGKDIEESGADNVTQLH